MNTMSKVTMTSIRNHLRTIYRACKAMYMTENSETLNELHKQHPVWNGLEDDRAIDDFAHSLKSTSMHCILFSNVM